MRPFSPTSSRPLVAPAAAGRWRLAAGVVVLVLLGWWTFSPALRGGWLWDDNSEITHNPVLRDADGWWRVWVAPTTPDYQPLKTTVQWIEWHLWGDRSTVGYHATTLVLHLGNALLLWRLFRRLGLRFAWFGAVWFAVHPTVVGSVAWIAELKNTLSLGWLLLAALAWLEYDERRSSRWYAVAWLCFAASLLAKASVVMFPVVLLLHAWWRRRRIATSDVGATAPFFVASLAVGLVTMWFQAERAIAGATGHGVDWFGRVAGAGRAWWYYLGQVLLPRPTPVHRSWPADHALVIALAAWALLVVLIVELWRTCGERGHHVAFGFGFFGLNLVPVLGFVDMSYFRVAAVADHFLYLPLVGIAGLLAAGASVLATIGKRSRRSVLAALVVLCGTTAAASHRYAAVFHSPEALWTYAVAKNPDSEIAQNNLGVALLERGDLDAAEQCFQRAVNLNPSYAAAHVNLGDVLARKGRLEEALAHDMAAATAEPDSFEARFNGGNALVQLGRTKEAIKQFEEALRISPNSGAAHFNLANALVESGRLSAALGHYAASARLQPESVPVRLNYGIVLAELDRLDDAIAQFSAASRLDPASDEAQRCLAQAKSEAGRGGR